MARLLVGPLNKHSCGGGKKLIDVHKVVIVVGSSFNTSLCKWENTAKVGECLYKKTVTSTLRNFYCSSFHSFFGKSAVMLWNDIWRSSCSKELREDSSPNAHKELYHADNQITWINLEGDPPVVVLSYKRLEPQLTACPQVLAHNLM